MSTRRLDDLRAHAQCASALRLAQGEAPGQRRPPKARLRELERACEGAEARLRAAEPEERRARKTGGPLNELVPTARRTAPTTRAAA